MCGGIVAISKYDLVSLVPSVKCGDVKILLQHLAAACMNDSCCCAELLVAGGREIPVVPGSTNRKGPSEVGGPHSVLITRSNWDRIVEHSTLKITGA